MTLSRIISASRRTDIPAFYSKWFMNRIRDGYCKVVNPMYPQQKTNPVSLKVEDVDCIVFWTRSPKPIMPYLEELDNLGYVYYFLFTIIGYPKTIDPYCPNLEEALKVFKELSKLKGKNRVLWRYDPIIFSNVTDIEWHKKQIQFIMSALEGYTERMIISFVQKYKHAESRMNALNDKGVFIDQNNILSLKENLIYWIGKEVKKHGIQPFICADSEDYSNLGVEAGRCIDSNLVNVLTGEIKKRRKDPAQRKACGCVVSRDVGANDTCIFECPYCYANKSFEQSRRNYKLHDFNASQLGMI